MLSPLLSPFGWGGGVFVTNCTLSSCPYYSFRQSEACNSLLSVIICSVSPKVDRFMQLLNNCIY